MLNKRTMLLFAVLLAEIVGQAALGQVVPAAEMACHPVRDLDPEALGGELASVPSDVGAGGIVTRWTAEAGDTVRLLLRTADSGAYAIAVRTAGAGPAFTAKIWDTTLTGAPVMLGPGHHPLLLERSEAGVVPLDCVAVRRVGEADANADRAAGVDDDEMRPFLGVEIGPVQDGGVTVRRTLPDTAASRSGVQGGDVLLTLAAAPTASRGELLRAIGSHHPGDTVELVLLRGGERVTVDVELGARPPDRVRRRDRGELVLALLDVRPDEVIADIGCGSGWLSETIAEKLGPGGRVYAVEIQESRIRRLRGRVPANVVPVFSMPDDVSLPENVLDTAMLHDVASHVQRSGRPRFYESVKRVLKPGGRLVVFGPHGKAHEMLRVLRENGFVPVNADELAALSDEELDKRLWDGIVFRRE